MFCIPKNVILFILFEQKKILNKKHLSQKLKELRICTILAVWQFSLRLMALRYMGKSLIVLKFAYSGYPEFLGQISSCKIGVKRDNKLHFFLLWDFKWYWCLHVNVNLDIIIYILVDIRISKMVIMPIMIIIIIIISLILNSVSTYTQTQ